MVFTGERYVPGIEGWLALQHFHRYYFVINQVELKDKVVLDIACGEGYGCNILSRFSGFVYGVDISEEAIDSAKKNYSNPDIEFLVGSTSTIPLNNKSVDVVISFETIEHHDLHFEMMREIKRILKDDGVLIISSPDKGFYEKYLPGYKNEFHVKELYLEEFKSLISSYFKYSEFFLQNNVAGSIIAYKDENHNYYRPHHIDKSNGSSENIEPRFNICIASDKKFSFSTSVSVCTPSFYFDVFSVIDNLNNTNYLQQKLIESIYRSNAWKIGRMFTSPIRKIKKLLKK
jgi:ubiquinone/menaquinone biosynthesis C-methylase UbiE